MASNQPQSNFGAVKAQADESSLEAALAQRKDPFLRLLPSFFEKNRERFFAACIVAAKSPAIASCSRTSILTSLVRSAQWGLLPDGVQAALVPFKGECTFQPMTAGLIQVARRSGDIRQVWAECVYEGDHFHLEAGDQPKLIHRPSLDVDKTDFSKVRASYACARWVDGRVTFVVVMRTEIDKIRNSSRAKSDASPWQVWPERMAIKTAIKRLMKLMPMANEEGTLLAASEHESGYVVDAEVGGARKAEGSQAVAMLNEGGKDFIGDAWTEDLGRPAPVDEPVPVTTAVREAQAKKLTPEEQRLADRDKQ